jgi:hypothetical protein
MYKDKLKGIMLSSVEKASTSLVDILTRRKFFNWFHVLDGSRPPTALIVKSPRSTWLLTDYLSLVYYIVVNGTKASLLMYLLYYCWVTNAQKVLATGDLKGRGSMNRNRLQRLEVFGLIFC